MVVDSSAVVAILMQERQGPAFADALASARAGIIGAPNLLEVQMVLLREYPDTVEAELDRFLSVFEISVVPFGPAEYDRAAGAFRCYGKGRHPAGLNFGDCIAYAVSGATGRPLLFKGAEFAKTDVKRHPASVPA